MSAKETNSYRQKSRGDRQREINERRRIKLALQARAASEFAAMMADAR